MGRRRFGSTALAISVALLSAISCLATTASVASADGQLDPSFGNGGSLELGFAPGTGAEGANWLLPLSEGRFLSVGPGEGNGFWITQNLANGSFDPSFGAGGGFHVNQTPYSFVSDAVREANGSIVLSGGKQGSGGEYDTLVSKVTPQGALDPTFGDDPPNPKGDGVSTFDFGGDDTALGLTLDSAGRVVLAGRVGPSGNHDVEVFRLKPDGSIDPSFGGPKGKRTDLGGDDIASDAATQGERTIVLANSGTGTFLLAYRPDGSLDPSFGEGNGIARLGIPSESEGHALLVQPDGRIVVAARFEGQVAIARVMPDGAPDTGFGTGGSTGFVAPNGSKNFYVSDLAEGDDGKVYAAASTFGAEKFRAGFVLRTLANGQPDPAWGPGGILTLPQPAGKTYSAGVVSVTADRRVLVGGEVENSAPEEDNRLLVRLLGDTTPPDTAIVQAPKKKLKPSAKKQAFAFEAVGDVDTTFECELVRPKPKPKKHRRHAHRAAPAKFVPCASPVRYGGLRRPGAYRFAVRAIDPAGNVDASPAVAHFKVLPKKHHRHRAKQHA